MMRVTVALFALGALVGCVGKTSSGSAFAASFDGVNSCGTGDATGLGTPGALTVEAWIKAVEEPNYGYHPILIFPGAVTLWSDQDGVGWFTDGTATAGASSNNGWMDGAAHHVAGVWDGENASLYVDGALAGFGPAAMFDEQGDTLYVGCWGGNGRYHHGLIDELRVQAAAVYTDEFEPPYEPLSADGDTIALWRFDEGEGDVALNEAGGLDLELVDVEWEAFSPGE